jgi:hypothetical protein
MDEQVILVAGTIRLHTRKLRTGVLDRVHVCILAMHERVYVLHVYIGKVLIMHLIICVPYAWLLWLTRSDDERERHRVCVYTPQITNQTSKPCRSRRYSRRIIRHSAWAFGLPEKFGSGNSGFEKFGYSELLPD